jgi:ATP-dependent protease ClpP protease subunit
MGDQVDPALSAKRAAAGRKGAEARWANRKTAPAETWREGLIKFRNSKPKDHQGLRVSNETAAEAGPAEMWLFDEIDPWWGIGARDVQQALNSITADKLTVHLNSPGGDVFEAHAIYNALRAHPANVTVQVEGIAASAASYIAMAGDTVLVASNATFMIHDAITFTFGNEADHTKNAGILSQQSDIVAGIYADRAGGEASDWRDLMRDETWYDAAGAIEAGLADGLIEHPDTSSGVDNAAHVGLFAAAAKLLDGLVLGDAAGATETTESGDETPAGTEDGAGDGDDFGFFTDALKGALA